MSKESQAGSSPNGLTYLCINAADSFDAFVGCSPMELDNTSEGVTPSVGFCDPIVLCVLEEVPIRCVDIGGMVLLGIDEGEGPETPAPAVLVSDCGRLTGGLGVGGGVLGGLVVVVAGSGDDVVGGEVSRRDEAKAEAAAALKDVGCMRSESLVSI